MPTYEITHEWSNEQTTAVVEKVQAVVAMAKKGQIPAGFRPISIIAIPGATQAHCLWEAPSAESLEAVIMEDSRQGSQPLKPARDETRRAAFGRDILAEFALPCGFLDDVPYLIQMTGEAIRLHGQLREEPS